MHLPIRLGNGKWPLVWEAGPTWCSFTSWGAAGERDGELLERVEAQRSMFLLHGPSGFKSNICAYLLDLI